MTTRKDLYNNLIEKSFKNLNMIQDLTEKTKIMVELSKAVALGSILEVDQDEGIGIVNKEEDIIKEETKEIENEPKEDIEEQEVKEVEEKTEKEEIKEVEEEKTEEEQVKQKLEQIDEVETEDSLEPSIEAKTIDPSVNVWTEETIKVYYDEITELKNYTQKLGEGEITKQVSEFSQGVLTNGLQDIGPANIESFLLYLKNILKA